MIADVAPGAERHRVVGHSVDRVDARLKCRGAAKYLGDLRFPGLLHAKVVRSPTSRGRLVSVDTAKAERFPGVVRVVTTGNLPVARQRYGHLVCDQPILADDVVRFAGEPVAIVVAETEAAARQAAGLVTLDIADLPPVTLESAGREPDLVHESGAERGLLASAHVSPQLMGNICYRYEFRSGDFDALLDQQNLVVDHEYTFPSAYQYAMEPHGVVAQWTEGTLELWSSCQHPFLVRRELATLFAVDLDAVRVRVPFVGGGFGSKSYVTIEPLAAAAALSVDGPVRLLNTVEEAILTTRQHNMHCRMTTVATRDGELLGRRVRIAMDTGAYATNGPTITFITGLVAPGPYSWPAVDVIADCVYTNRSPAGSYRGFGASHTQWIGESQLDEVAQLVGCDRVDLRRRSLLRRGDRLHPDMKPVDADLQACLEEAWRDPLPVEGVSPGSRIGRGVGIALIPAGAEYTGNAVVRLRRDGRATVLVGTSEIGQGARTVFAQIVSELLRIPPDAVTVPGADTATTPYDRSTGASRSTTLVGLAVYRACEDVIGQLADVAARHWKVPGTVTYADGILSSAAGQSATVTDALRMLGVAGDELVGRGRVGLGEDSADFPVFWETCAAAATISVEESTGRVRVLQVVTAPDIGKALNPRLVEVQDSGCSLQALGQTLFEELEHGPGGELLSPSLVQYQVPTTEHTPFSAVSRPVENGDGPGPFGAKGCGEGPFGAVPAAVMTALADAGVHVRHLPATPQRVWTAMADPEGIAPTLAGSP